MPNTLISGPAGAAKSQLARELLRESNQPTVVADFQAIVVSLLLLERGSDGLYPPRPEWILPTAEYVRQSIITAATERGINLVVTNSDGDPLRRRFLLDRLGENAVERVVDPGESIVRARLSDPITGVVSGPCAGAIARWYSRLNRG